MLFIGDYRCIPSTEVAHEMNCDNLTIMNFSSYVQQVPQLTNLVPRIRLDMSTEENFDMSYFDYIFNQNQWAFIDLMYVMNALYAGTSVYLIVNHSEYFDKVAESLAEIIKQRYGYLAYFINDMTDYSMISLSGVPGDFSVAGLTNLDIDRQSFMGILSTENLLPKEIEE